MRPLNQLCQSPVGMFCTVERGHTHVLKDVSNLNRNIVTLDEFLDERGNEQPAQEIGGLGLIAMPM